MPLSKCDSVYQIRHSSFQPKTKARLNWKHSIYSSYFYPALLQSDIDYFTVSSLQQPCKVGHDKIHGMPTVGAWVGILTESSQFLTQPLQTPFRKGTLADSVLLPAFSFAQMVLSFLGKTRTSRVSCTSAVAQHMSRNLGTLLLRRHHCAWPVRGRKGGDIVLLLGTLVDASNMVVWRKAYFHSLSQHTI